MPVPVVPLLIAGAAALGVAALAGGASGGLRGSFSPVWPLRHNRAKRVPAVNGFHPARAFGFSKRSGTEKVHAGIDLGADRGTVLVATEDGQLVKHQGWDGDMAKALLLETDSGVVVLYGAIAPHSYRDFGLKIGDRVKRGQPVAKVGMYPGGSTMLHFELYRKGTRKNERWMKGQPAPANLLNPTRYLELAGGSTAKANAAVA